MPPKRNKSVTPSGATPTGAAAANKNWETALTAAVFEENDWRASVSMVQAERAEDEKLISALLQAVQQPLRKLFSVLSWEDTLEKIDELGNPKTRKIKDVPMFCEVTEVAKSIMDVGEEITVDLIAKLIKFQLLTIKNNDIARRAAEHKAVEDNAHVKAGLNSAGKDQGGKGAAKGKKAAELPVPTKDTKLKRRGEEENTIKYIDDEPDDGPQHYILILGFCQPHLISALDSLGIHVSNIIKLGLERKVHLEAPEETVAEENHQLLADQEVETLKQQRQRELDVFWKHLDQVLNSGNMGSRLSDVARLNYSVKIHLLPQDECNTEAMLAFGAAIFEGVACLVYDSLDWRRQYSHYLNCTRLIQVPEASRSIQQSRPLSSTEFLQTPRKKGVSEEDHGEPESPVLSTEVDMRYYCDLLDRIPTEITSVPLILHCMLEQVVASEQEGSVDSEECFDKTDQDLISYMLSSVLSLPQDEEDKKELMEDLGMQNSPNTDQKHPLLLNHHDERARRLHQLPVLDGFDVIKIEADIMKRSHVWTNLMSRHTESAIDRLTRSQELLHFCTDESMSWSELQRLLQLFVFESMPLTTVDENSCIKGSQSDPPNPTPWDNPVEFTKHLYWSNSGIPGSAESNTGTDEQMVNEVTITDLQKTLIHQLENWNFVEKHSAYVFPQVIQSASETFRCVDTFHSSRDNAIYVVCHNPMTPQRSCKEYWDASLHTDVGFRNYLEYVAHSISEWTRQEEEKWQMEQKKKEAERNPIQTPSETDRKRDCAVKSPISDTLEPYIREDSLKAWKIEQDRLKEEEQSKKTKKEKGGKATPKVGERMDSVKENKKTPLSSRKSRDNMSKTPSSATLPRDKTRDFPETPQEPANERRTNVFTGYSLNGKLVQVTGKVQSLYPCDEGQIDVESFHFTQGLTQVKVCVKKDGHHFYTHISDRKKEDKLKDIDMFSRQAANGVKPDCEIEKFGSFHAVLSNGIQLSCSQSKPNKTRGQTVQPTVPSAICTDQRLQEQVPEVHCESGDNSSLPPFLNLYVSLPNGLILHFDCEDSADGESYVRSLLIRQRFYNAGSRSDLTPNFSIHTEVSRVITGRGTVIKHKKDGSTEVLFADGTVSTSPDSGPVCVLVPHILLKEEEPIKEMIVDTKDTKDKKGKADSKVNTEVEQQKSIENEKPKYYLEVNGGSWTTTTSSGFRVASVAGKEVEVQPILAYHATDPFSGTAVVTREDKVLSVLKKDGAMIVDHADGTRISTFYQQGEQQQHLSSGEKLVRVEKAEFATVIMDYEGRMCDVIYGDGTSISATAHGSYKIYPHGGGVLHIDKDGGAVYTSHQSQQRSEKDPLGQYVMNHRDVLCHVMDPEGNHFQVNADGQITVMANESELKEPEAETELQQNAGFKTHPPRLFVVHEDCSASELLRAQDVEDLLQKAYCDSSVAVLTDPLPDSKQSFGITLLRPCPDINSHWLSSKQDDDIIPTHLKSRKWESFPASEKRTPGPPFGTTLGCCLELKEKPPKSSSIRTKPVLECPSVLLVRQMTQHPPVTEALRRKLQDKVKAYLEQLLQRENQWEKMQLKDPRTAEEKVHQNDLLQLVLSLPDAVDPSVAMEIRSADVVSLYTEAVRAAQHPHKLQEKTEEKITKSVKKKKQKSLWENRINQHRQELQEQRRHRNALRHHIVTPYFHPELKEMSLFTNEDLNLSSLTLDLPPFPKMQRFSTDSSSGRSSSCEV
ncbi:sperm-associated antigen 17-like isoform X2 [Cyprinus carpio]|uniref:Sperm-associated antigen 17-like isoform X2 n=1 Tax=Cyprinus carpio TaxID=7962 RepID=A0A9Q9YDV6_CYPCA|nr:sperm-associated antigen 17-like isoform X2 [Cyprinus carpio]